MILAFFNKKVLLLDAVGFNSIADYLGAVFVNKGLLLFSATIMSLLYALDHFISINIFDPARGIYILFGATMFDVMLGISVAVKEKKFDSYKLQRAWARLVTQIAFVALLYQVDLVWDLVNSWMVSSMLLAFVLATFWSAFKNAYKLKWIQPSTYEMLEKILSIQDIFNSIFKHKKSAKD